jgi:hypothetical protein
VPFDVFDAKRRAAQWRRWMRDCISVREGLPRTAEPGDPHVIDVASYDQNWLRHDDENKT